MYNVRSHGPTRFQLALISALALLLLGIGAHSVGATPVTGQTWASSTISSGQTDTATITVAISSSCPSGDVWAATSMVVTDPNGNQRLDGSLQAFCGSSVTMTYPTDFLYNTAGLPAGVPNTNTCGTYMVTTLAVENIGTGNPISVPTSNFSVNCATSSSSSSSSMQTPPPSTSSSTTTTNAVPQFPIPNVSAFLLVALLLPVVVLMARARKTTHI